MWVILNPPSAEKRNSDIIDEEERERNLVIDPGQITINGINQSGPNFMFNKGKFLGVEVPLGELKD